MATLGKLDSANLNGGQKLAVKYFTVALALFGAQILFGLLAGIQYLKPDFIYGVLDFSVNRLVHINALVVWVLFGFIGSVYWLLEDEAGIPVGACAGNLTLDLTWQWRCGVSAGPEGRRTSTLWLIIEGRDIEAPRWAYRHRDVRAGLPTSPPLHQGRYRCRRRSGSDRSRCSALSGRHVLTAQHLGRPKHGGGG
jgi:nitric oxide reductase subunit B